MDTRTIIEDVEWFAALGYVLVSMRLPAKVYDTLYFNALSNYFMAVSPVHEYFDLYGVRIHRGPHDSEEMRCIQTYVDRHREASNDRH